MKQIAIPLLNLELNINPIAFKIFNIPVYWYAILIVASIGLALLLMYVRSNNKVALRRDSAFRLRGLRATKMPYLVQFVSCAKRQQATDNLWRSDRADCKSNNTFGIKFDDIIDLSLILIPISFVCARLYYVIFNLNYYTTFAKIMNIKDRRTCNIWRNHWRNYNSILFL